MEFIARENETAYLNDLFNKVRQKRYARVALVLGRRGTGKTSLVLRAAKNHPDLPFVYLYAFRTGERDLAHRWGERAVEALGFRMGPLSKNRSTFFAFSSRSRRKDLW